MPKYNLALIPLAKGDAVVQLAQKFSVHADQYLLGMNALPHVTLYQFKAEENEIAAIWQRVKTMWPSRIIYLDFLTFSFTTSDKVLYWISLIPSQADRLHAMHHLMANCLMLPAKTTFDPHMTLLNTRNKESEIEMNKISKHYKPISDQFVLCLGKSGEKGQLLEIIYTER